MADSNQTESALKLKHVFRFYEVKDDDNDDETFCVQCEWFNKSFDLNDDTKENEEYCRLTITDFNNYWQITIDRNLLLEKFKPSNALKREVRSEVLMLTFQGIEMIRGQKVSWTIVTGDKLKMKLKTFYEKDLPGIAGSFFIESVQVNKYAELNRLWYRNSALASRSAAETEEALKLRVQNVEENCKKLEETVAAMKSEAVEYKFTIFSNFTKVLNTKKDKINALARELEKVKKRRENMEYEETNTKRELDIKNDEEDSKPPRKLQKNSIIKKTTVTESSSSKSRSKAAVQGSTLTQPMVSIKNESASLDAPSTSRFAASAPAREDANINDSDSDSDDVFSLMERTN